MTVNYSNVVALAFTPINGMSVIVGALSTPLGNTLNATEMRQGLNTNPGNPTTGAIETGIAIKGPIEQVNALGGTFTVMGQTVSYNTTTQFPSTQANTLVVGYVVRVTATPNAVGGQMTATRVELVGTTYTPGTAVQVSGIVQNLNTNARTFTLSTLTVNYSNVVGLAFTPINGMSVIVGALSTPLGNTLNATELRQDFNTNPGDPNNPGTPVFIDQTASLIGPVDAINPIGNSFTALGQAVTFSNTTQFVTSTGATFVLTAGNVVKVSAMPSTIPGQLVATRVELVSNAYTAGATVQVSGTIQNVNTLARTFTLGGLTVNYTSVTNLAFTPTAGMNVIAAAAALPIGNVFNATALMATSSTIPPGPGAPPGVPTQPTIAVVSGTIVSVLNANEFNLTGVTVRINPATQFANGSPALLLSGMSVMVTGTLSGGLPNAILDATMIRFSGNPQTGASRVLLRGPIEFIDLIDRRITVLGITITVPMASISIKDDDADRTVALADLTPGTIVTVAGMGTSRQLSATFVAAGRNGVRIAGSEEDIFESRLPSVGVALDDEQDVVILKDETLLPGGVRVWLWAPLDFVQPPLLSAFGVPVTTSDSTRFFLAGHNRRSGSPSAFFEAAELGGTVRIEGLYLNGTFVATRVCNVRSIRGSDLERLLKIDD